MAEERRGSTVPWSLPSAMSSRERRPTLTRVSLLPVNNLPSCYDSVSATHSSNDNWQYFCFWINTTRRIVTDYLCLRNTLAYLLTYLRSLYVVVTTDECCWLYSAVCTVLWVLDIYCWHAELIHITRSVDCTTSPSVSNIDLARKIHAFDAQIKQPRTTLHIFHWYTELL